MYYAQYGEDKILNQIFAGKTDGVCVEVGGFEGVTDSNTYFFEKLGWRCLIVEPMPDFCEKIGMVRHCDIAEIAASDAEGEVQFHFTVDALKGRSLGHELEPIQNLKIDQGAPIEVADQYF